MSDNSLESLLEHMKEGGVTQGWGALSIFNRGRLNRLLEQQYIQRFDGYSFLPPLSGRIEGGDKENDYVELENIALGQPLLSFNTASLTNSTAVLTMNIMAGRYSASHQSPGAAKTLLSAFTITEPQGFTLEMDIDLSMVVGEIDRQGKVRLNLAEGVNFRCNLAGNDEVANARFAKFFQQSFEALPPHRSVFQLGMLDFNGYSRLTPKSFRILTQAAPGAKARGTLNFGDGAVVVFIRLQGNTADGRFPPTGDFPYLIPDDQESDGSDRYSASLILSEAMLPYLEGGQLDVLNNLLFPGENVFEERERHAPRDLAVFGNISAKQTRIALEPAFKTLKAGGTEQFTLRNWKGEVIQASSWRAVSLQSHTAEGHGTIAGGLYTAASPALIGHDTLHVVVTAEYENAGTTYTASALLLVVFDGMTVAPRVATYPMKVQSQPVVLKASTLGNASVTWKLLAPEYGTLTQGGNEVRFSPDARAKTKGLVVQQVEASGAEKRQSALLLVNAQQLLRVDPPYVPAVRKSVQVQLKEDATLLPNVPRRWKVISGGGSVDASGRFTAPAQGTTSSTVVQCTIVRNGVVFSSGYSVIDLAELEPEPSWGNLAQFNIKIPGGSEQSRLGSLYGNGYQQLKARILAETQQVDGKDMPLSVTEKASMRLMASTNDAIDFVHDNLEGIPEEDDQRWRTRWISNRFALAVPRFAAQDQPPSAARAAVTELDIYLNSREKSGSATSFFVMFQADSDKKWWKSTDITDANAKIEVTALATPDFQAADYTFERVRVDGGGVSDPNNPDDDFDFHLRTVDYWKFSYSGRPGVDGVKFETLEFVPVDGNDTAIPTSTIRWESEQLWERHVSWTGYVFRGAQDGIVSKVSFDRDVKNLVKSESLDIDVYKQEIEAGQLVISLHRSDGVTYVKAGDASRDRLTRTLAVALIDKNGNAHKRIISFLPPSVPGSRNRLVHRLFSPSVADTNQGLG